ncbi:Minor fimbrium subunit Mfa1 [Porphyromonas levii]|uniref:Mfa1 family fimbria major subunit n=1 Tax=Porphyromonas levii TaxID=28114 RepID=UPI001BAADCB3|nr:Mfa1 family fimbria major subunit [Porphyromonas levii]MBR8764633.1 Minor fimbrium subunit Mfa1 [Porphyromonas levii]
MKKFFSIGALALALIMGVSSCKNEKMGPEPTAEGNTFASVRIALDGASLRSNDYNYVGEWGGQDVIERVAVYMVDNNVVSTGFYSKADFTITPASANGTQITITPKKAIKTTEGNKDIYVLINGTSDVETKLAQSVGTAFEEAYAKVAMALKNEGSKTVAVSTSADKIAKVNSKGYDEILMTNGEKASLDVQPNITETATLDAAAGDVTKNRLTVEVKRAVARVMVTTKADTYTITEKGSGATLGTISDIHWVLGQGEASLYLMQKSTLETPNYNFVTSSKVDPTSNDYKNAVGKYDYSGLWRGKDNAGIKGIKADVRADGVYTDITPLVPGQVKGEFILPTTHKIDADREATGYRKGNTPYVLVRAKFTPAVYADEGEDATQADGTFYYGLTTHKFYKNINSVTNPEKGGVVGQGNRKYEAGKVIYWAWVNPDKTDPTQWLNSPVLRNNIYHISISGFKTLGWNWNPLVPNNPDDPNNPTNPDPDPDPDDPNDPDPVDPDDPLSTPETWMSVDMKVLPWKVHSYSVELGI